MDVNWKKLYQLYREERLTVRKRGGLNPPGYMPLYEDGTVRVTSRG